MQTSSCREMVGPCIKRLTEFSWGFEAWVIHIIILPYHSHIVCAETMEVQLTQPWWKVLSFGCSVWKEEPSKFLHSCVRFISVKETHKPFKLRPNNRVYGTTSELCKGSQDFIITWHKCFETPIFGSASESVCDITACNRMQTKQCRCMILPYVLV